MRTYNLTINDRSVSVTVKRYSSTAAELEIDGTLYRVRVDDVETDAPGPVAVRPAPGSPAGPAVRATPAPAPARPAGEAGSVLAPIPGLILEVFVKQGDAVDAGQPVLKMEAMKMENVISAPIAGTVGPVHVRAGDTVNQGQALLAIT